MKLLITPDQIKTLTPISQTVDQHLFENSIEIAQLNYLKPKIGKELYNELVAQNSINALTNLNQTLMGYIRKSLSWYSLYVALPQLDIRLRNSGIVRQNSESSTNVEQSSIDYYRKDLLSKANTYIEEMIDYLNDNYTLYPLYKNVNCDTNTSNNQTFRIIGGKKEINGWLKRN